MKKETNSIEVIKNHYTGSSYLDTAIDVFDTILQLLKPHCGPYASYAILPTQLAGNQTIDQYTKDGINIVKSLKTDTPMARHVMRLVSYVGERVDNVCHDGTTTAMMMFCDLAARLLLTIPSDDKLHATLWRQKLTTAFSQVLSGCELVIDYDAITVDTLIDKLQCTHDEAVWAMAYHQAVIASKGDTELSRGIADVLASTVLDLHGQYLLHHSGIETEERFSVKHHDYDFELPGSLAKQEDLNHALGSEFRIDNALLLVTASELIRGNAEAEYLVQYLESDAAAKILTKPLIILSPALNDPRLFDLIRTHNSTHPHAKIIIVNMHVQNQAAVYSDAICATAGIKPLYLSMESGIEHALIDGVAIEQRNLRVYLKNLYQKTGARLHPSYTDPTRDAFYTAVIKGIRDYIEMSTRRHDPAKTSEEMLTRVLSIYRFMSSQQLIELSIGGSSHEHIANRSVVRDAYGAAVSAVKDGVILGGHQRLLAYVHRLLKDTVWNDNIDENSVSKLAMRQVLWCFATTLLNTLSTIYGTSIPDCDIEQESQRYTRMSSFVDEYQQTSNENKPWFFLETSMADSPKKLESGQLEFFSMKHKLLYDVSGFLTGENKGSVLLQPVSGYQEFFKRLHELLPKIINTTALIDVG